MSSNAIERAFPLTPLQQTVLLASVRDPEGSPYQVQCQVDLLGELDSDLLAEAWRHLFRRHPAFRSFFAWEGREEPLQVVRTDAPLPWTLLDWSREDTTEQERLWAELRTVDAASPFDLAQAPIVRLTLVKLEEGRHRLLWSVHHALADGWSGLQVFREMLEEYDGLQTGSSPERPEPPSFGLFVSWLAARDRDAARAYWSEQLAGLRDASTLPAARVAGPGPHRETAEFELDRELTERLAAAATRMRVTPYTLLLGAWSLVLDRHAPDEESVAFATTVTERPPEIPDVGSAVGMFLNTVPLRIPAPGARRVGDWLHTIQKTATEARHHGVSGLGEITRWADLEPGGTLARSLVVFESFPDSVQALPQGRSVQLHDIRIAAPSDLPLTLLGHPGETMRLELAYDTALYSPEAALRLLRLTGQALKGLSDPAKGTLDEVDILGPAERRVVLEEWSRSPLPEPAAPDVLDAFDAAVATTPNAPALKDQDGTVSFQELDRRANRLAHRILALGLAEEALVGIPAEPVADTVVSIVACLKAGVGYVPFDPTQPAARLDRILGAVDRVLATGDDARWGERTLPTTGVAGEPASRPQVERRGDRVAYVIFTSGSTGRPKGVVVERGHLARSTAARLAWYQEAPRRFLLLSSLAVDSSVAGLYWSLCTGGCLILAPSRAEQDAEGLAQRIQDDSVTTTLMVPSLWRTLLEEVGSARLGSLECVVVAGEACPPSLVARHHQQLPGVRLVNEYGPSEATVWATAGDLRPEADTSGVTIGGAVPFVRVYLLDAEGRPVPPGASGEICLGGDTVARGYLDPDPHGASRFVPDPFRSGGRMYRTGDRGRFREDGRLDFLGRVDDQFKVRGYRVEPGEIESVLNGAPGVLEAAVVFHRPSPESGGELIAVVRPDHEGPSEEELRSHAQARLPGYMVPRSIGFVDSLPRTAAGKLDRRALTSQVAELLSTPNTGLPDLEGSGGPERGSPRRPETEAEKALAEIWTAVLGVDQVFVDDDFFQIGGDSLLSIRVIARAKRAGYAIRPQQFFATPTIAALAAELDGNATDAPAPDLLPDREGRRAPLSFAQEGFWFLDRLGSEDPAYNVSARLDLRGPLDPTRMAASFRELLDRHDALRATVRLDGGEPWLDALPAEGFELEQSDLSRFPDPEEGVRALARETATQPFDLLGGRLVRGVLARVGPDHHVLLLAFHHMVVDGESVRLVLEELGTAYRRLENSGTRPGDSGSAGAPPASFRDYSAWERDRWRSQGLGGDSLRYWIEALGDVPERIEWPRDDRVTAGASGGGTAALTLPSELADSLTERARSLGCTPFVLLLAAYEVFLHRHCGQNVVVVGTPVAHRPHPALERAVGYFQNVLPLRGDLRDDPTFSAFALRTREVVTGALEHADVPFERIVEAVVPHRHLSTTPLFQTAFTFRDGTRPEGWRSALRLPDIDVQAATLHNGAAKFEFALEAERTQAGLTLVAEYAKDRFGAEGVAVLLNRFGVLLRSALEDPDRPVSELPVMTPSERERTLGPWSSSPSAEAGPGSALEAPDAGACDPTVLEQVESIARETPDRTAIEDEGGSLTYGELVAQADDLARTFRGLGVTSESLIAVALTPSREQIVSLLATWKAGCGFLSLDPEHPAARLGAILDDAAPALVVADSLGATDWVSEGIPLVAPTPGRRARRPEAGGEAPDLPAPPEPSSLAYVIYTSGSTGAPKGVEIEHGALANLAIWHREAFSIGPSDRAAQLANPTFDASVWETWGNLAAGATLVVAPSAVRSDPRELRLWFERKRITAAFASTPVAEVLLQGDPLPETVRVLLTGGARLRSRPPVDWRVPLVNCYGPSECAVVSTSGRVSPGDSPGLPSIGRPIRSARVFVLDDRGLPVPPGVPGELAVAGPSLARGYRNDPEKTRAAFREARFPEAAGTRLYHTGDRVRFRLDGSLAFLGRVDRQVKIRGQRIELGEVEAALLAIPGVAQGVAEVREGLEGDHRLVAFVVGTQGEDVDEGSVRSHLMDVLPGAMVPARVLILPELPLNASGKVDRRALAALQAPAAVSEAPQSATEIAIAEVWREVLGGQQVGRHDNFFTLGGHSLNAISVVVKLEETLGVTLPLAAFFDTPTVAGLAEWMKGRGPSSSLESKAQPAAEAGASHFPLSPDQARLWYLQQLDPGSPAYHIPLAYRMAGRLDASALQAALDGMVRRHEALRVTVDGSGGEPVQTVHPPESVTIHVSDLPADASEADVREALQREATTPFDLERGPLFRVGWLRRGEEEHHLILTLHHLVADGWSAGLLARELSRGYAEALGPQGQHPGGAGPAVRVPGMSAAEDPSKPSPSGWGPWCADQKRWLESPECEQELAFWQSRLANTPPLELPTDHRRPDRPSYEGRTHGFRLPLDTAERLEARCREAGVTPYVGLLSGLKVLLHRYAGQTDLAVGTVVAGRTSHSTETVVGLFANTIVVRSEIDPQDGVRDLLARVGRNTGEALGHQRVPFGAVVEAVQPPRDPSRNPLFQVAFLLQNQDAACLDLPGVEAETLPIETGTAKFDLTLAAQRDTDGYALYLEYATDLFRPETIERMSRHFATLLTAMAEGFVGPIAEIPMVRNRREWTLHGPEWAPSAEPLHVRVSEQARRTPDSPALTGEDGESLSYRELDIRSHRIGVALAAKGVGAGDVIGVGLPRSPDMVAALLGILKAGAAYLPLDPDFPRSRLEHIAGDAGPALLITSAEFEDRFPVGSKPVFLTDLLADTVPGAENEIRPHARDFPAVGPEGLAYLIYTSGSTGGPKGVEITHGNAVNLLDTMAVRPGIEDNARWLAVTTLSFDISVLEIFGPLLVGGEVILATTDTAADGRALKSLLERTDPTQMQATPSMWRMLLDAGWQGDGRLRALVGGEALPPELARELTEPCAEVWNMYGPTETTVWSTCGRVDGARGPIQVGTPVANTAVYILDDALQPVPRGVPGELYIAGAGVAVGYRGRPDLTAERFLPNPFGAKDERMYRTGDRVRLLDDRTLEVLGRRDGQVKIRGFRIETGEVEAVLEEHPAVRRAVARAFEIGTPDARLVAFVVADPDQGVSGSEIRRFARKRLPRYMVPSMISLVDDLPLTPNGKVDRKALADPLESVRGETSRYQEPTTEAQRTIAQVWGELLPGVRVGRGDNFFELGGHSLLSIRAVAEIRRRTGRELDPRAFFFQSVEQLAAGLEDDGGSH